MSFQAVGHGPGVPETEGGQGSQQAPRSWKGEQRKVAKGKDQLHLSHMGGAGRQLSPSPSFSSSSLSLLLPFSSSLFFSSHPSSPLLFPPSPLLPTPPPSLPLLSPPPPPPSSLSPLLLPHHLGWWPTAPRMPGQCSSPAAWPLPTPRIQHLFMVGWWKTHFHVSKTQLQRNPV